MKDLILWFMPERASTLAPHVDELTAFIFVVMVFFLALITATGVYLVVRFRRRAAGEMTSPVDHNRRLEIAWTAIPSVLLLIIFVWGFRLYMEMAVVPKGAMEIQVTGQKWFWNFGYPSGYQSIGELVVPVDTPVKLLISSRDVIHSVFIPSFRLKMDAVPGRYAVAWFQATKTGTYPMYCTEYCGTGHSKMYASVRILTKTEYEKWVETEGSGGEGLPPEELGKKLYTKNACVTCHSLDGKPMNGPTWLGLFGHDVKLANGETVKADENYLRESILKPQAKIVAGFQPVMPTYQGLLKEAEVEALIAFIKTVGKK